jgi:iron complex outermembrane recepter protein
MRFALCVAALWLAPAAFCQEASQLDPVTVYGDRLTDDPGSVSAIDRDTIADIRADHPADILNLIPGVKIDENSGQESLISIRSPVLTIGAGQGSFLILTNGVPNRASAFGNVNMLIEPHLELADAIEVVRGPGSAKYGSNAVHGLVNTILPYGDVGSSLTLSGSTLSRYRADGEVSDSRGWLGLSVQKDLGWRQSSGLQQYKLSATRGFDIPGGYGEAFVSASKLDQDTAGFIRGEDAYEDPDTARSNPAPDAFRQADWAMAAVRFNWRFDAGDLRVTPYLRGQEMEFSQHFLPYDGLEENGHWSTGLMSRFEVPGETIDWRFGADLDYASGYLKETQDRPSFGPFPQGVHYDYTVETVTAALWAEAEWRLTERWTMLAGLRGESHDYDYTTDAPTGANGRFLVVPDRSDDFQLLTPKLGIIGDFGDVSVYANYARGERAPQATDLYRLQATQEEPAARVETLDSLEIGLRGKALDGLSYDLAAYAMQKDNFFFRDAEGLNVTDGETEHFGIEAAWVWEASDAVTVSGSLSWSEQTYAFDRIVGRAGETIRDGNRIDTAPEWLADLRVDWQVSDRLALGLGADHVGEYFTDAENLNTYDGHTVFDARARFDLTEELEVFLIVRNLLDERYATRADFAFGSDRYFPGEPLNATLGVRRQFGG